MSVFEKLNSINVSDKTEEKNGLTYLSWAWAWGELKKLYPDANYTIYETAEGCFYHTDGCTAWVKVGVTVEETEHIEYLPVMDYRNKSIPTELLTSFDVNKAVQRALTKAIARHGLGLYIYAGEDLPESEKKNLDEITLKALKSRITSLKVDEAAFLSRYKLGALTDITADLMPQINKDLLKVEAARRKEAEQCKA